MEPSNDESYNNVIRAKANISVPVKVQPRINANGANAYCYGEPTIAKKDTSNSTYQNPEEGFMLVQNICIEIPIGFSVDVDVQEACIECCTPNNVD